MCFAGMLCQLRRDVQAAHERATAAIALCTAQGFALYSARGTILQGWAMAEQGQGAAGLAQMRQGLVAYQATAGSSVSAVLSCLPSRGVWESRAGWGGTRC